MMKRIFKTAIALITIISVLAAFGLSASAAGVTAIPTVSSVTVDGKAITFDAFNIGGNNYFKLRDLAMALNSTTKHISISTNDTAKTIYISSSGYYIAIGGELTSSGNTAAVTATPTTWTVYLNGKQIYLTAYNIGGANYFKLRDVGAAIDFAVLYDVKTKAVSIDTTDQYYIPTLMNLLQNDYGTAAFYNAATGVLNYYGMDSGFMSIQKLNDKYFYITSNVSSNHDYAILQSVVAMFVGTPENVISALKASAFEGKKTLTIDHKTVTCFMLGVNQTIEINWS